MSERPTQCPRCLGKVGEVIDGEKCIICNSTGFQSEANSIHAQIVQGGYNAETSKMLWRPDLSAQEVEEQEVLKLADTFQLVDPYLQMTWPTRRVAIKAFAAKLRAKDAATIAQLRDEAHNDAMCYCAQQAELSASQDQVKILRYAAAHSEIALRASGLRDDGLAITTLREALAATAPKGETE